MPEEQKGSILLLDLWAIGAALNSQNSSYSGRQSANIGHGFFA